MSGPWRSDDPMELPCSLVKGPRLPPVALDYYTLKHMHVSDDLRLLVCVIPKAGFKFWTHEFPEKANVSLKLLSSYRLADRRRILQNYTKVVFTKEPFARLWSAYNDKLVKPGPFMALYGRQVQAMFKSRASQLELKCGHNTTFTEFSQWVLYTKNRSISLNEHWQTYSRLCRPCDVKYDIIGKMEDFKRGFSEVSRAVGLKNLSLVSSTIERVEYELSTNARNLRYTCLPYKDYVNATWASLVNKGFIDKNETRPDWLNKPVDLTTTEHVGKFEKSLLSFILSKLPPNESVQEQISYSRRTNQMIAEYQQLPKRTLCRLKNLYKKDCYVFKYFEFNNMFKSCDL